MQFHGFFWIVLVIEAFIALPGIVYGLIEWVFGKRALGRVVMLGGIVSLALTYPLKSGIPVVAFLALSFLTAIVRIISKALKT